MDQCRVAVQVQTVHCVVVRTGQHQDPGGDIRPCNPVRPCAEHLSQDAVLAAKVKHAVTVWSRQVMPDVLYGLFVPQLDVLWSPHITAIDTKCPVAIVKRRNWHVVHLCSRGSCGRQARTVRPARSGTPPASGLRLVLGAIWLNGLANTHLRPLKGRRRVRLDRIWPSRHQIAQSHRGILGRTNDQRSACLISAKNR